MPQADGTILIDTEINADGMKAGSKEVEAAVRRMANSVNDLGTKARTALNKQVDSFAKLNKEYAAQEQKVEELKKKVAEYGNQKIPTEEYKEIQNQITQAKKRMDQLIASQERYLNVGGKSGSRSYKKMQYDIDDLAKTIKYAEGELKDLEETGKAFTLGNATKEAVRDMEKLAAAERKLSDMNNRLGTSYSSIKDQTKGANKSLTNTGKAANSANFGIGRMLGTSILFSFVFQAIGAATDALVEGFTNLARYSGTTNNSISMLTSSLSTLKNSLATAFAPILNVVAPILSKFIDMLSTAASYVSMFFAFLSGQSTYTRAIAVQQDYAASLQDTAGAAGDAADATNAAADAAERYLSPLDDINKFTAADSGSGGGGSGGGGGGGTGSGPLFEEVPIDNKFASLLDSVLDKLIEIRDIFMDGFWDGLGNYKPILEELRKDLSSIGAYLTDIFTDADVKKAAKQFVKSFVYNFGKVAGSIARVGLTIAELVVGGVESYLSENTGRIKRYLVNMFDIGTEVNNLIGSLTATVAEIFSEVFGSQLAQDLAGDILGILSEAFLGITQLASGLGRDIINFIARPIMENKDLIIQALLATVAPLETIAQSIETFVQGVADKILALYNEHFRPFVESLTSGISEIVGTILTAYNENIAPILDAWGEKFDEVLNGPVADAVSAVIDVVGKAIDIITILWEEVLVPLINWLIENILPIISPIVETLGAIALDLLGTIAEVAAGILETLGGLLDFLIGVFTGDWDRAFSGLESVADGFHKAISSIFNFIEDNILRPFDSFLQGVFATDWEKTFGVMGGPIESFFRNVENIWNSIKRTFSGVITFINGVFSGDWRQAWQGIKDIFSGIMSGLSSAIRSPINGIIGLVNGAISGINTLIRGANRLPGVNIPTIGRIPYLASGAVIPPNKEFLAVLGDQRGGNNIEAPESLIRKIVREESGGGTQRIEVPVYLGKRQIALAVVDGGKLIRSQTGKNPFELA